MSLLPYWYDPARQRRLIERPFGLALSDFDFPPFSDLLWQLAPALHATASTISSDDDKFQVLVDVQHFSPEEITVKTTTDSVIVEGKHEEKQDEHGYISRQFVRRFTLPEGCIPDTVQCSLSSDGVLTVKVPKKFALPGQGERIIPIEHTGPVHKKLTTQSEADKDK